MAQSFAGGYDQQPREGRMKTSLFRSQEMVYLQIVISREAAHETIKQLGESLTRTGDHPGLQFTDVSVEPTCTQGISLTCLCTR
jgi:hypothetical protein